MAGTNPRWDIRQGDAIEVLRRMEPESVHCVVTSPPYYGLRNYGLPGQVWGGEPGCEMARTRIINDAPLLNGQSELRSCGGGNSGCQGQSPLD